MPISHLAAKMQSNKEFLNKAHAHIFQRGLLFYRMTIIPHFSENRLFEWMNIAATIFE